jgi:membrane protein implicated in regulation of membrane protease activity
MNIRQRRFIGIILTVIFLICYALAAMAVGGVWVVGRGMLVELFAFIILGVAWVPVAMLLVRWMSRPDAEN